MVNFVGAKFKLGLVIWTRAINDSIIQDAVFARFVKESLGRHTLGDWGDLCEEDKQENEYALGKYLRLFSSYDYPNGGKIWIITEADRSLTTILLPEDY